MPLRDLQQATPLTPITIDFKILPPCSPSSTPCFPNSSYPDTQTPNPTLAVGPNHVLQAQDFTVSVFSKEEGNVLRSVLINTLWQGVSPVSGTCGGSYPNGVHGQVNLMYDQSAKRWWVSSYVPANASTTGGLCIAISKTALPDLDSTNWYTYFVEVRGASCIGNMYVDHGLSPHTDQRLSSYGHTLITPSSNPYSPLRRILIIQHLTRLSRCHRHFCDLMENPDISSS